MFQKKYMEFLWIIKYSLKIAVGKGQIKLLGPVVILVVANEK